VTFGRRLWVPSESRAVSIDWLPPYARWLSDLRGDAASADSQEREFISVLLAAQLGIRHPHEEMRAPGHVGEGLVDGDALNGRREIAQDSDGGVAEIDPDMEIRNHLNQPRELVKGTPVAGLWS
jgi:hypothetical protein